MKVMTYNIRHGLGGDLRVDLERIACVIEGENPDLVGLNEVDVCFHKRSGYENQLSRLAERLGMEAVFGPAIEKPAREGAAGYGNGLLLKGEVCDFRNIRFTQRGEEPRSLLVADVIPAGSPSKIRMLVTHMGLTPWMRRQQGTILLEQLEETDLPAVAAGDWNVTPGRSAVTRLAPALRDVLAVCEIDSATFPCRFPRIRLDYIFCTSHFRPVKAAVVATPGCPSDHLPVVCELEWTDPKGRPPVNPPVIRYNKKDRDS
ncbi:endonuclease/exonuclease/phosphatase family metal-dependent hydrolase [Melghirimyces profundicolus]|uniref:Endonuclease/exonuclease/phosphatase family metal-dependent hydrolase n=1 Tax=Melghirimyces profundicolus TaxID=1242148 RepID=A0A2T6C969_9BACL|nr:endonuclease/exonuclease/phosphatase family protein [Melghirimyces profundicolus]PTX64887.1 endonuclease/exonuclease/phosphatase family metal-dependent hydrolase [Melghirimyces profundicolus]